MERYFPGAQVMISSPTWGMRNFLGIFPGHSPPNFHTNIFFLFFAGNHKNIFNDAKVPWSEYRYYDPKTIGLDFEGMIADIKARIHFINIYNSGFGKTV